MGSRISSVVLIFLDPLMDELLRARGVDYTVGTKNIWGPRHNLVNKQVFMSCIRDMPGPLPGPLPGPTPAKTRVVEVAPT